MSEKPNKAAALAACCDYCGAGRHVPRLGRRSFIAATGVAIASGPFRTTLAQTGSAPVGDLVKARPPQAETIFRGGYVLTMDPSVPDLQKGDVHVKDGVIAAVGESLASPTATVMDATGFVVAPGFVDTHWHMWTSLMRNMATNVPGRGYFPVTTSIGNLYRPEDMYLGTLLSGAEAIDAGITTVHDWCHNIRSPDHARADARALKDSGLRGRFSYGPSRALSPFNALDVAGFAAMHDGWEEFGGDGLLAFGLGWRGVQAILPRADGKVQAVPVDTPVWRADYDAARQRGVPITLHANSTAEDGGHIAALDRLGLLHLGLQVVHATHSSPAEVDMLARAGAVVTVSPFSELVIGYGITPIMSLVKGGLTIGLSVDSTPLTGSANMAALMKMTQNLYNGGASAEFGMTAKRALELGTIEGARSLGLADRVGSIRPGKRADLIMVNATRLAMSPMTDMAHMVVHSAEVGDIDTVMVDGRILKQGGKLTAIDTTGLVRRATQASLDLRAKVGLP